MKNPIQINIEGYTPLDNLSKEELLTMTEHQIVKLEEFEHTYKLRKSYDNLMISHIPTFLVVVLSIVMFSQFTLYTSILGPILFLTCLRLSAIRRNSYTTYTFLNDLRRMNRSEADYKIDGTFTPAKDLYIEEAI